MSEKPFKGWILVSDLDGTLLDSNKCISSENIEAIRRFRDGGGVFTLGTGRMFRAVEPYLEKITLDIPAIVFNGAAIYDFNKKKILWQQCLHDSVENVAQKIIEEFPGIGMEVLQGDKLYVIRNNIEVEKHMNREGFLPAYAVSLEELPRPWFKILLAWDPLRLPEVEAFMEQFQEPFRYVYSEPQFLEILNAGASKGVALLKLLSMNGYDKGQVIAVGDNMNDLELIQTSGVGIAVGNAHEELKKVASFVCRDNNNSAVAHVVEMLEDGLFNTL